jgi:hypothetical protein
MLTREMMAKIEDLTLEFTTHELMELRTFLKMAQEVRCLNDGALFGLAQVLMDKGNPNKWNLVKLVTHEMERREKMILGLAMANRSSDLPMWKDIFPKTEWGKTGTMVPPGEDSDSRQSELYRRGTKPQPGDE